MKFLFLICAIFLSYFYLLADNVLGWSKTSHNYAFEYDLFLAAEASDRMGESYSYDSNGNIGTLLRLYDGDAVQDAAITYDGNQLSAVYDVADDYHVGEVPQFVSDDYTGFAYDANGNLTADPTRQITSITYQPDMNLPKRINFANGNQMQWAYSTDGTKRMSQTRTKYITLIPKANGDTIQRVNYYLHTERFYGDFVKIDNSRWRVYHPTGHVETTPEQDQIMAESMAISDKIPYDPVVSNCATAVKNAINKATGANIKS
ncbi:MAG: hypothetical protein IJS19_01635, partial [Muribaculaceae bacterium]|nr:hypothetical protein [Muribaculaceae bacterium]